MLEMKNVHCVYVCSWITHLKQEWFIIHFMFIISWKMRHSFIRRGTCQFLTLKLKYMYGLWLVLISWVFDQSWLKLFNIFLLVLRWFFFQCKILCPLQNNLLKIWTQRHAVASCYTSIKIILKLTAISQNPTKWWRLTSTLIKEQFLLLN